MAASTTEHSASSQSATIPGKYRGAFEENVQRWAKPVLLLAAVYNACFGLLTLVAPDLLFELAGMEPPRYRELVYCIGMIVGVYGVGYGVAAFDVLRHWPIVLVGFLGKVLGTIGFVFSYAQGTWPLAAGWLNVTNDVIWIPAFGAMLYAAERQAEFVRQQGRAAGADSSVEWKELVQQSKQAPQLVVFVRHFGCTFCRELLSSLAEERKRLEDAGYELAVVHMGSVEEGEQFLKRFDLGSPTVISDPLAQLYGEVALPEVSFLRLFDPRVALRGAKGLVKGHGVGPLVGYGMQSQGVGVLKNGQWSALHEDATLFEEFSFTEVTTDGAVCTTQECVA